VCCFVFRKNNVGKVVNSLNSTVNNNISENWISTGILLVSSQFDIEIEININLYISAYSYIQLGPRDRNTNPAWAKVEGSCCKTNARLPEGRMLLSLSCHKINILYTAILYRKAEPHSRDKRQMPNVVFSIWRSGDFSLAQSGQTPNAKH